MAKQIDSRNSPQTWRSGPWPKVLLGILCMFVAAILIVVLTQGAPPELPK